MIQGPPSLRRPLILGLWERWWWQMKNIWISRNFQKYAKKHQIKYIEQLFKKIPLLIGKQFKFSEVGEYKKRELEPCLDLLENAKMIHRIYHSAGNGLPLGAEINQKWLKVIFLDIALCQSVLGLDLATWFLNPKDQFINQGHIAEAFIGQELLCYSMPQKHNSLYFWKREKRASAAEIDFLFEHQGEVVPIEVKSGLGKKLKSMHLFLECHPKSSYGILFSAHNHLEEEKVESIPLYAAIDLFHESQKESLKSLLEI